MVDAYNLDVSLLFKKQTNKRKHAHVHIYTTCYTINWYLFIDKNKNYFYSNLFILTKKLYLLLCVFC